MDLFNSEFNTQNLLPHDGFVSYYGQVFDLKVANEFYQSLLQSLKWENDQSIIFGKLIITKRKVAWYGDKPFNYKYSHITKKALFWTPDLIQIKTLVEKFTGETFNSCLCNLYHDGNEGMAFHSDAEKDLKKHGAIASVTFGAERLFHFKHKTNKTLVSVFLEHGSLLLMKNETQDYWLHRLPPTKKVNTPRINLTFRTINH